MSVGEKQADREARGGGTRRERYLQFQFTQLYSFLLLEDANTYTPSLTLHASCTNALVTLESESTARDHRHDQALTLTHELTAEAS